VEENPVLGLGSLCESLQADFRVSAVMLSKMDVAVARTADVADELESKPVEDAAAVPAMVG